MKERDSILSFLKSHKKDLADRFQVQKIGVFGSIAKGEAKENSDVDVIFEFSDDVVNVFGIKQDLRLFLEEQFGRSVDLCREKYIKPQFKKMIVESAEYA